MKKKIILIALLVAAFSLFARPAHAVQGAEQWARGGFEMSGYLSAGFGWQRFSNQPVTDDQGSSFGGPMGQMIPNAQTGVAPNPGEDFIQAFVQRFELDFIKRINDRARVRADIYYGRANSGSTVAGLTIEHAIAAVRLGQSHNWEIAIGRLGLLTGFESYEYFNDDTISKSILSRASLYPGPITGVMLSGELTENVKLYLTASNTVSGDTTARNSWIPGGVAVLEVDWGPEELGNYFALTAWAGPTTFSNRHLGFGGNVDIGWYFTKRWQLGFEALYDGFRGGGGPSVNYAAALINLHYDINERWTPYVKYAYSNQFEQGAGAFNLTGAKQQIYEASTGLVYRLADSFKVKLEGRIDTTIQPGIRRQLVYGAAMSFDTQF